MNQGFVFSVMLVVSRLEPSIAFYERFLGFQVVESSGHHCRLIRPGASLYLVTEGPPTQDKPRVSMSVLSDRKQASVNLIFHVPDVWAVYQTLKGLGLTFLSEPCQPPWGGWRCFVQDPDGYLIELEQPPG